MPTRTDQDLRDGLRRLTETWRAKLEAHDAGSNALSADEAGQMSACADELDEVLSVSPQPEGWQPISSAPRDGTMILVYPSSNWVEGTKGDYEVTCWDVDFGCWMLSAIPDDYAGPTHWMPLPSTPVLPAPEREKESQ
jgi:hypothetical protein